MIARIAAFAAALVVSVGVLTGCAGAPAEISSEASAQMQTTVAVIAESAAAGDAASALAGLDALQQQLETALADGSVSAERAASIQRRLDLVRADLQPAPAPTPAPVVEPVPAPPGDDDDDSGNENSGPGNNNGKGKGKGKDD